jgi:hypothetical protein
MNGDIRVDQLVIVHGASDHRHALDRLESGMPGDVVDLRDDAPDGVPTIQLRTVDDLPEGGFRIRASGGGRPVIEVEGGPFSGVIYGTNALIDRLRANDWTIQPSEWTESPALAYRTWWNWDHTTNWDIVQIGVQEIGVMNPYHKPPDGFLADFKRVVDFMSENRIAALAMYGFLRESHGGIEAAQELCRYATERGVRILPGVAIHAYGGVVWEMDHEFNLATWLRKHPHLAAEMERPPGFQLQDLDFPLFFPRGDYSVRGCPSKPENQQWMEDAIAWLAETFEIGGINIEAGDYGVCGCVDCQKRRAAREDAARRDGYAESWSHADMADFYPRLYDATLSRRPNAWIYSEIQWDNLLDAEAMAPLRSLPEGGIYQHTANRSYWNRIRTEMTAEYARALPTKNNVFRTQFNCQWNGDFRTERYRFNGKDFAEQAKKAAEVGFKGLTVWGEVSPYVTSTELSYLAYARFTWDPSLSWAAFMAQEVAPRVGGEAAAERYVEMLEILDAVPFHDQILLDRIRSEGLSHAAATSGEVSRRWLWLAESAQRRSFNQMSKPESAPW